MTVLNGHIHQVMQKVEGNVAFHTAASTAFPQPAPGTAPSPGPLKVADDKLRALLGTRSVTFVPGQQRLAVIDQSLQGDHLTDVLSSDQHSVKPWFNGKLDVAPPVVDLTAQGFTLIGGRLDYIDGKPVAVIVYRHQKHVINLFVAPNADADRSMSGAENVQGFNIRRWTASGLSFAAVSDLNGEELLEFVEKFEAGARVAG